MDPGATSQRGSARGCSVTYKPRIDVMWYPCAFHPTISLSSTGARRMPSSSAWSVKTWAAATGDDGGAAVIASSVSATLSSVTPSLPINSSSVGKVVGIWGQRISSAFQTGRWGNTPRPSEQNSNPSTCVSRRACTFIFQPAAPCVNGGSLKISVNLWHARCICSRVQSTLAPSSPSCHLTWSQQWTPTSKPSSRTLRIT